MIVESLLCDVIRNLEQPRGEKWVRREYHSRIQYYFQPQFIKIKETRCRQLWLFIDYD